MTGRQALTSSRQAFEVVDAFEQAVARYTGAPYCVAVDSGCNALYLCLMLHPNAVSLPTRTYLGVPMAVKRAGLAITWRQEEWAGLYRITPELYDAALRFTSGMYIPETMVCLSFQAAKLLPIGRGGAILTDDYRTSEWLRRMRNNGRTEGQLCGKEHGLAISGYTMYMAPPDAARGLWLLTYYPESMPDQQNDYDDISEEYIFA